MRRAAASIILVLALAAPALCAEPFLNLDEIMHAMAPKPQQAPAPQQAPEPAAPPRVALPEDAGSQHRDNVLAREHERFTQFATEQVMRMNATMIGGRASMQVHKDGRHYRASYKHIDLGSLVCQVRRSDSNPNFFVGTLHYKEQILESLGPTAEACRRGPFDPVSEKNSRIIYSSKPGGGWQ